MTKRFCALSAILFSLTVCTSPKDWEFSHPQALDDGWEVSTPKEEGFDQDHLKKIISEIPSDNPKLDGIVIARNGKLIVDQYFNGYSPDKLHKIWSITKIVSGTTLGIAVDKGLLSEKDSIYKYLGDYIPDTASRLHAITVEHLITMTSGLEWKELGGPESIGFQLPYSNDWIEFTLKQSLLHSPGEVFNYSTGNTMLLAPVIKSATGQQVRDFAKESLFNPLGVTHYEWDKQSEFWTSTQGGELPGARRPAEIEYKRPFADLTNTGSGLRMGPRDLCKLGQLYLDKGRWNDRQVVSEEWVESSIQPHFGNDEYGYHWRLITFQDEPCFYASGFGLQRVFVFPEPDLVIVLTQHHYETMPQGIELTNRLLESILALL